MLNNTEKHEYTNARAVRVCEKVMSVSVQILEEPYIFGILRKTGYGMDYCLPCHSEFVRIVHFKESIVFFNRVFGKAQLGVDNDTIVERGFSLLQIKLCAKW